MPSRQPNPLIQVLTFLQQNEEKPTMHAPKRISQRELLYAEDEFSASSHARNILYYLRTVYNRALINIFILILYCIRVRMSYLFVTSKKRQQVRSMLSPGFVNFTENCGNTVLLYKFRVQGQQNDNLQIHVDFSNGQGTFHVNCWPMWQKGNRHS